MTPLDAETQRILKWADELIDDFDGYPSHLILMRDHIRSLSERMARVEAERDLLLGEKADEATRRMERAR